MVPINILNPIPGTPFEKMPPLPPMEILKTIACFRFILPKKEIMIAGGRTVNLRDMQSMVFTAGASALMVGNYLTTLNQPVEKDLQMLKDLGLDPSWDKHDFADQDNAETHAGRHLKRPFRQAGECRFRTIAKFRKMPYLLSTRLSGAFFESKCSDLAKNAGKYLGEAIDIRRRARRDRKAAADEHGWQSRSFSQTADS